MTQECRPAPGAENGSWHVLWSGELPVLARWWQNSITAAPFWAIDSNRGWQDVTAKDAPAAGYTYGLPLTPPPREMTREEMMEIAKDALGNGGAVFLEATVKTIARGTKP